MFQMKTLMPNVFAANLILSRLSQIFDLILEV